MKHSRVRFLRRMTGGLAALILAGSVGYRVHDYRTQLNSVSAVGSSWDLDYFTRPGSFSEVEATRADLEGLASRYRAEIRTRFLYTPDAVRPVAQRRTSVIAELEQGAKEFHNAPGESFLVQDLLLLLKQAGSYDRWLDVYLDLLYRRPTEEVIALFVHEAQELGSATGRAAEVESALRHLLEIPIDSPTKRQLQDGALHGTSLSAGRHA